MASKQPGKQTKQATHYSFSDKPITSQVADQLGFGWFAKELAGSILTWDNKDCLVIGLYGEWGNGKTSIKNMCLEHLGKGPDAPIIVEFNPWCLDGSLGLIDGFFTELGSQFCELDPEKYRALADDLKNYSALTKGVIPFIAMLCNLYITGSGAIVDSALKGVAGVVDRGAEHAKELGGASFLKKKTEINKQLERIDRRVLVVVDDIDRLSKEEIKTLFRLVKSTADFSNVTYLLLFERGIVEKALAEDFGGAGKEFMQKIIQVGLNIPKIQASALLAYTKKLVENLLATKKVACDEKRLEKLLHVIEPFLGNLRSVHRLLNSYSFQLNLFAKEGSLSVNPVDLLGIEVIREFESGVYESIFAYLDIFAPDSLSLAFNKHQKDSKLSKSSQSTWALVSSALTEEAKARLSPLVDFLFPGFGCYLGENQRLSIPSEETMVQQLLICHNRLSRRYFHFTVPTSDLAQHEVDELVNSVKNPNEFATVLSKFQERGMLQNCIGYLADYADLVDITQLGVILKLLFKTCEDYQGTEYDTVLDWCRQFATGCLNRIGKLEERSRTLKKALKDSGALYFCVDFIFANARTEERNRLLTDSDTLVLKKWFLQAIADAGQSGHLSNHRKLMRLLFIWEEFDGSGAEARKFVRKLTKTIAGCIAYIRTSVVISYGTEGITEHIDLEAIEKFTTSSKLSKVLHAKVDVSQLSMQDMRKFEMFRKSLELYHNPPK